MVEIRLFARLGSREHFSTRLGRGETLLDVADRLGVPVGQACSGLGVCGSCGVRVLRGDEHLTEVTLMERKDRALDLEGGWRLACQALAVVPVVGPAEPAGPADDDTRQIHLWHPAWGLPLPDEADS